MSRQTGKSRIARALRADAAREIGNDLDLWPQIRAQVGTRQAAPGRAQFPSRSQDTWTKADAKKNTGRLGNGSRNLNLTRVLPAPLLAICMIVTFVTAAYIVPLLPTAKHSKAFDVCALITQAEADALAGQPMEQQRWQPNRQGTVACAYFGDHESINVLVADFNDENEAHAYLEQKRTNMNGATTDRVSGIDGMGDEGYSGSRTPSNPDIRFWDVAVREHSRSFIVTWMTGKPDPSAQLDALAHKVAERLP